MKVRLLTVAAFVCCSFAVLAQTSRTQHLPTITPSQFAPRDTPREPRITIRADRIEQQGAVVLYRGNVRMETEILTITADELDFNVDTREADLRGAVHAKVLPGMVRVVPLNN